MSDLLLGPGTFTVELFNVADEPEPMPAGLRVEPLRWGAHVMGGPDAAEVRLTGPRDALWGALGWLRWGVLIRDTVGEAVWWGYVHGVDVVVGGVSAGLSFDAMHNHVRVLYAASDANGETVDGETAPVINGDSTARYGTKELLYSAGEATAEEAEALRDRLLAVQAWPQATPGWRTGMADEALLTCRGWWEGTGWVYYADPSGRSVFETAQEEQRLGYGFSGTGFMFHRSNKKMYVWSGRANQLRVGDRFVVSGSANNNGTFTVQQAAADTAPRSYAAATISFDPNDDILDSAGGLGFLAVDDAVQVEGSAANSGYHLLDNASTKAVATDTGYGGVIAAEAAGPTITLTKPLSIKVEEATALEMPGPTITITLHGQKMAQRFTPSASYAAGEALIRVRKDSAPSDSVQVDICVDSSGSPGASLGSATVAGSALGTVAQWVKFAFATPIALTGGVHYWLVVSRTGTMDGTHNYLVGVDEGLGDASGSLKLWTGSAWVARNPDADMAYQVWGVRETTAQVADMLESVPVFAVGGAVEVRQASGLLTRHYRDGRKTARDEIEALLARGTSTGGALWARVTPRRTAIVEGEEPPNEEQDLLVDGDGLYAPDGTRLPPGRLPVGKWARLRAWPVGRLLAGVSPFFLERVEYDARTGRWEWEPRGAEEPGKVFALRQG